MKIPREVIKKFEIEYLQIIDKDGNMDDSVQHGVPIDKIQEMYRTMVLVRVFDEKLFKLQRSGKIGTYPQVRGQEACQIGSGMALQKEDWMVPSFRETGVFITRQTPLDGIIQYLRGDPRANKGLKELRNLPVAIPVGSQPLHGVGLAWAEKMKGTQQAAITYFGDGATTEGDVHEAMTFAASFKAPCVFFCQDNQWAISTPRIKQTAADTIAQMSVAYGMPGIQVDGNCVLSVYVATMEALERARKGEGPTLIEALTYRMGDHTTSDDASKYRSEEEVKEWEAKDPILRLRNWMQNNGHWDDGQENQLLEQVNAQVDEAVEKGTNSPLPGPEVMFDNIYAELPKLVEEQKQEYVSFFQGGGAQ